MVKLGDHEYYLEKLSKGVFSLTAKISSKLCASDAQSIFLTKIYGVDDVVPSMDQILILSKLSYKQLKLRLNEVSLVQSSAKTWKLPIWFSDFEDWKSVEKYSSLTKEDYISAFLKAELEVCMLGFLPGFIYLNGLNKKLQIPRKENPSLNPLPNVLAVGGPYAGIYSLPSPAGWNILGKMPIAILQMGEAVPMLLNIGDRIMFEQISKSDFESIKEEQLTLTEYNHA